MVRDIDCMRDILLQLENVSPKEGEREFYFELRFFLHDTSTERFYNILKKQLASYLLYECGLVGDFKPYSNMYGNGFTVSKITNKGYDFLDKVRNDKEWENIKPIIKEKGLIRYLEEM